jgi:hypothetical protein
VRAGGNRPNNHTPHPCRVQEVSGTVIEKLPSVDVKSLPLVVNQICESSRVAAVRETAVANGHIAIVLYPIPLVGISDHDPIEHVRGSRTGNNEAPSSFPGEADAALGRFVKQ